MKFSCFNLTGAFDATFSGDLESTSGLRQTALVDSAIFKADLASAAVPLRTSFPTRPLATPERSTAQTGVVNASPWTRSS